MDLQLIKQRFGIIGNSLLLDRALEIATKVASTDLSVLITGQSGVGKEFFPQIIHAFSPRKHSNYIAVNCGAIPEGTIDSELFGHEKGAFTGATDSRKGYFEMASGGTIFLDEVAELPQTTQVRLLRVLQTGEFIKVGSSKVEKTDVRVVAATNINLQQAIASGKFREDLFYRLSTVPILVPPLCERPEDIYLLFRKFTSDVATQYRMPQVSLNADARRLLESYSWPGNIRQLKNVAEQISVIEPEREIGERELSKYLPAESSTPIVVGHKDGYAGGSAREFATEREILYNILFEMRSDIAELKSMLMQQRGPAPYDKPKEPTVVGGALVRSTNLSGLPVSTSHYNSEVFDTAEEVSDSEVDATASPTTKEMVQKEQIIAALAKHKGSRKEAAKELFISERTLYRRIKDLEIEG